MSKYWLCNTESDGNLALLQIVPKEEYVANSQYDVSEKFPVLVKILWSKPMFGYESGDYEAFGLQYLDVWTPIADEDIELTLLSME